MLTELTRNEQIALALTVGIVSTFRESPLPGNVANFVPPTDNVGRAIETYKSVLARVEKEFRETKA